MTHRLSPVVAFGLLFVCGGVSSAEAQTQVSAPLPIETALAQRAEETSVGRIGDPKELANLVAFLAQNFRKQLADADFVVHH